MIRKTIASKCSLETGSFVRQWGSEGSGQGQLKNPRDVAVSEGEVFVCDSYNERIQVFGVDGSFVRQWGTKGSGQGQFNHPMGVAVSDGEVLVCDYANHRIQVFDVAGTFLRKWGTRGSGEGQHFRYLAVSGGEVYVCDTENSRVVALCGSGARRTAVGGGSSFILVVWL